MKDDFVMEGQYAKKYTEWQVSTGGYARDMTMRDHFAGLAMQAHLSMPEILQVIGQGTVTTEKVCKSCYEWADAMLKERIK